MENFGKTAIFRPDMAGLGSIGLKAGSRPSVCDVSSNDVGLRTMLRKGLFCNVSGQH